MGAMDILAFFKQWIEYSKEWEVIQGVEIEKRFFSVPFLLQVWQSWYELWTGRRKRAGWFQGFDGTRYNSHRSKAEVMVYGCRGLAHSKMSMTLKPLSLRKSRSRRIPADSPITHSGTERSKWPGRTSIKLCRRSPDLEAAAEPRKSRASLISSEHSSRSTSRSHDIFKLADKSPVIDCFNAKICVI